MKLIPKILMGSGVVLSVVGVSATTIFLSHKDVFLKKPFIWSNYVENSNSDSIQYTMRKDTGIRTLADGTKRAYIDDVNDDADISLFYNGPGTITNIYMLRLAMLTKSRVYYAIAHEGKSGQERINMKEFSNFLNNKKMGVTKYGKSEIINVGTDLTGNIVDKWKEIIKSNPTKKINIWWNGQHVFTNSLFRAFNGTNDTKIYDLAGFKNVNIHLVEDGPSNWGFFNREHIVTEKDLYTSPKDLYDKVNGYNQADQKWMYSPSAFKNVDTFYSDRDVKKVIKKLHAHHIDPIHLNKRIFNERFLDLNNIKSRLMKQWPLISGSDWKKQLDILKHSKREHPSKGSLIFMGSYGLGYEHDYIKYIWEKYHDKYNIFYKGHPGHSAEANWVKNVFNQKHLKTPIYVLEAMINSEELTRDHVNEGLKFDKFVAVESQSGAIASTAYDKSVNDPKKDILEVYKWRHEDEQFNKQHIIVNGSVGWQEVLNILKIT